jgi:hypothetical protein
MDMTGAANVITMRFKAWALKKSMKARMANRHRAARLVQVTAPPASSSSSAAAAAAATQHHHPHHLAASLRAARPTQKLFRAFNWRTKLRRKVAASA